jgi:nuclease-like protein
MSAGPPGRQGALAALTPAEALKPAQAVARAQALEPDALEHTMPLVPFTPIAALAPAASATPVAALDPRQARLAVLGPPSGLTVPAEPAVPPWPAVRGARAGVAVPPWPAVRGARAGVAVPEMTGILGQLCRRGSPAFAPIANLAGDPRLTRWVRTAAACTVAGAAVGVLVDWRLGLAAAALAGGASSLYGSRTSAVIPPSVRACSAQRRTRRRLARLAPFGYLSLHTRAIPGTDAVIDHLVVGPGGIYAVGSEVWDRRLPVRATRGGGLFHGPLDQAARLERARWGAAEVSRLLGPALGQAVAVRPAMVIYGPAVPWIMIKINGVDVFCGRRLRKYLRREACGNRVRLDEQQTEALHAIAAQVFPPAL